MSIKITVPDLLYTLAGGVIGFSLGLYPGVLIVTLYGLLSLIK